MAHRTGRHCQLAPPPRAASESRGWTSVRGRDSVARCRSRPGCPPHQRSPRGGRRRRRSTATDRPRAAAPPRPPPRPQTRRSRRRTRSRHPRPCEDALPRGRDEGVVAVVRGRRESIGRVGRRDADDAAVAGREGRRGRAVVAGRRDDDDALRPGVVDRGLERRREPGRREGHQGDVGMVIRGPDEAFDDVAVATEPIGRERSPA